MNDRVKHWADSLVAAVREMAAEPHEAEARRAIEAFAGDLTTSWLGVGERTGAWYAVYRAFALGMTPDDAEQLIGIARLHAGTFDAAMRVMREATDITPEEAREAAARLRRFAVE